MGEVGVRRSGFGPVMVVALVMLGTLLVAEPSAGAVRAKAQQTTVDGALASVPTAPVVATGYRYKDFAVPAVARVDGRGCGKRERVLLASAKVKPSVGPGCSLRGGVWSTNHGTRTVRGAAGVDVVPLVSEKSVWTQGGFGWTNAERRAYLKWQQSPARECAVGNAGGGSTCAYVLEARGTGGRGPSVTDVMSQTQWNLSCPEVSGIVGTLASWGLAVDPAARARMAAAGCGSRSVSVSSLNAARTLPRTEVGNPFMAPAAAASVWSPASVLSAPAGPVVPASLFGLHVPDPSQAQPTVPFSWLRLWDSKTGWEPLEQNRGTYYWKTLDDAVAYAESRGLRVLYVFGDTPPWAGPSAAFPPTSIAEYERFARAVVARYGNRIAAYEVWNEPNLYAPMSESVADLVDMTKVLSDVVHSAGVSSLVLTPSTTMRTDTIVAPYFAEYLSKLGSIGWPVDGYAFHTYPRAAGGPAQRVWAIAQFKQMLHLAGAPSRPIWDSEINYGLGGLSEARRPIGEPDASGYLSQTFIDSVRLGVSYVDWYLWFPTDYSLLGIQLNPSTVETNAAWTWTYDQLVGSALTACGESGDAVVCGFVRGGEKYVLAYSSTGSPTRVTVPAGLSRACGMDGVCQPVDGGTVTVGIRPVRVS